MKYEWMKLLNEMCVSTGKKLERISVGVGVGVGVGVVKGEIQPQFSTARETRHVIPWS